MAMTLHLDIVSAETSIYSGPAEMVFAPAIMGEVGITPRHSPLLTQIKAGEVRIRVPDQANEQRVFVSGGILEIQPHVVTILADTAIRADDLDEAAAIEAKNRAEQALKDRQTDIDYAKAQAELVQAMAQLRMIQNLRKLKH